MRSFAAVLVTSMLAVTPCDAQPVTASSDTAAAALEARAQALYQEGRERYHLRRFEEARAAFQSSLERFDSPNTRMYLGRTLAQLGRVAEAFSMLDRAARDARDRARQEPRYEATATSARAEADALRGSLGWLRVQVQPSARDVSLSLNGGAAQRGATGVELPFAPGPVRVRAIAEGFAPAESEVLLEAGALRELTLELTPVASRDAAVASAEDASAPESLLDAPAPRMTRRGPIRTTGAVLGVAGFATLAAGLAFGLVAWDQYQTVLGDPTQRDLAIEGLRNRDTANVLFATGGVLTVAGALLFFFAPRRAESPAARLVIGPAALGVAGSF